MVFDLFLRMPNALKTRKNITARIVTKMDIETLLSAVEQAYGSGDINSDHCDHYKALTLFGAFTGQRPHALAIRGNNEEKHNTRYPSGYVE